MSKYRDSNLPTVTSLLNAYYVEHERRMRKLIAQSEPWKQAEYQLQQAISRVNNYAIEHLETISPEEWAKAKLDAEEAQEIDLRAYQRQRSQQASEAGRIGGKRKAMSYVDRDEWIFSQYQALSPKRNDWANVISNRMGRDTYWKPITTRRITQIVTRMKESEI